MLCSFGPDRCPPYFLDGVCKIASHFRTSRYNALYLTFYLHTRHRTMDISQSDSTTQRDSFPHSVYCFVQKLLLTYQLIRRALQVECPFVWKSAIRLSDSTNPNECQGEDSFTASNAPIKLSDCLISLYGWEFKTLMGAGN